jgi:hypothetical protein
MLSEEATHFIVILIGPLIERQTLQWPKENEQKDKQ